MHSQLTTVSHCSPRNPLPPATTRTRFPYHWPLLWQTLLSLLRFLTTYASSLTHDPDLPALIDAFLATLSLAVAAGDTFLPDTAAHDDLFLKEC